MNVLYLTWDGPQVTYLESLFLPIFDSLREHGIRFHVLQFTWAGEAKVGAIRDACARRSIPYEKATIIRRWGLAGLAATILHGSRRASANARANAIDVLMARSTIPALIALRARGPRQQLLFDADGLEIDERVEFAGLKPGSLVHRALRAIEAHAAYAADAVVCRSPFGLSAILARAGAGCDPSRFFVVSNGRDEALFRPQGVASDAAVREKLGISHRSPLVVYCGSLGQQYCVAGMAGFFTEVAARHGDARFLVLCGDLAAAAALQMECGEYSQRVLTRRVEPDEVPAYLSAADLGVSFREPSFSMKAVAPIKNGEYLLCGVPVLANQAAGDVLTQQAGESVKLLRSLDRASLSAAAEWFLESVLAERERLRASARDVGLRHFGLRQAVESYRLAFLGLPKAGSAPNPVQWPDEPSWSDGYPRRIT